MIIADITVREATPSPGGKVAAVRLTEEERRNVKCRKKSEETGHPELLPAFLFSQ